ncbi:MAG: glycoside hydrolase, partial [Nitrospira sp.]|nr:glycoside hydrolase [Nitrospira sp.]
MQGVFLDSQGMIHVIFWGGDAENSNIYYAKSPVQSAGRSSSWSRPIVVGGVSVETTSASIQGDDNGNLVVIFNGQRIGYGVYESHSTDGGDNWSRATPLYLTYDQTLLPFSLRLASGRDQRVHATWSVVTILGEDRSLHYASFDPNEAEWSLPKTLNEKTGGRGFFGPSYPSMVDTGDEVVIMYNSGNPFEGLPVGTGRPVQMVSISKDNGGTWEVPVVPFYRHNGRSGEHTIVKDSENVVHAIFIQRIEYAQDGKNVVVGGIWHSAYKDGKWSNPERFIPSVPSSNIHAVVSQGNVILAVWIEDQGTGQSGVWYSYLVLDAKEDPVIPYPTLQAVIPVDLNP